ncbi:MAG: tRNA (adenosine(37)-N6)-methyltransferase TrmM, partial [Bacteroidetes bacterium]
MSNSYFKFKQFAIYQDKTAMKVGVDSVVLGAWTKIEKVKSILDIGAGTGLLSL